MHTNNTKQPSTNRNQLTYTHTQQHITIIFGHQTNHANQQTIYSSKRRTNKHKVHQSAINNSKQQTTINTQRPSINNQQQAHKQQRPTNLKQRQTTNNTQQTANSDNTQQPTRHDKQQQSTGTKQTPNRQDTSHYNKQ